MDWTPVDQLGYWEKFGAPKPIGRRMVGAWGWKLIYSRRQYTRWIDGELRPLAEIVARIP
jgi:hypothetical protein